MAASSRPGRDRRPRTATTINHVGQGDLKGVKYTKIHVNVYLFFRESKPKEAMSMGPQVTGIFTRMYTAEVVPIVLSHQNWFA